MTEIKIPVPADHIEYHRMSAVTYSMLTFVYNKLNEIPDKEFTTEHRYLSGTLSDVLDKKECAELHDYGVPKDEVHQAVAKCSEFTRRLTVYIDRFVDEQTGIIYRPDISEKYNNLRFPMRY